MNVDDVRKAISYDPETGLFRWLVARGRCAAGSTAGYCAERGYRGIRIFGKCYYEHRIAFLWMTGEMPEAIDHISGNRSDNRWANLREVTRGENQKNQKRPVTNKSGVIGVFWDKARGKWTARIKVNRVSRHLGHFDRIDAAAAARKSAERSLGFHENHGRVA